MGWNINDTLSLTPYYLDLIRDELLNILRIENGNSKPEEQVNEKVMKAQNDELAKKIKILRQKGKNKISGNQLFGALGAK